MTLGSTLTLCMQVLNRDSCDTTGQRRYIHLLLYFPIGILPIGLHEYVT